MHILSSPKVTAAHYEGLWYLKVQDTFIVRSIHTAFVRWEISWAMFFVLFLFQMPRNVFEERKYIELMIVIDHSMVCLNAVWQ